MAYKHIRISPLPLPHSQLMTQADSDKLSEEIKLAHMAPEMAQTLELVEKLLTRPSNANLVAALAEIKRVRYELRTL